MFHISKTIQVCMLLSLSACVPYTKGKDCCPLHDSS
jgi:hypothetical protein